MIKSAKKLKDLSTLLHKDNNVLITNAIELLRDELPFEGAIALLTEFYNNTGVFAIRKAIEGFMNDLKDQSASVEIISEIRKQWKPDTVSMLVSSCWQSGLDYSNYSLDLAAVFLNGDYVTALECMTVIEESANELNRKTKDEILKLIKESPLSPINEKRPLIQELISILDN